MNRPPFSTLSRRWIVALAASLCVSTGFAAAPERPLPSSSVYQLSLPLGDQNGRSVKLADWRGKPALISMFYTSCEFVCPRIIEGLKRTQRKIAEDGLPTVPVLLVSFDPQRDDAATLKKAAAEHGLNDDTWTLARAEPRDVRKLAALLRIQYKQLPSGDFNHSSVLILLDADGRIVGRTTVIGEADPAFVKLAEKTLREPAGK